MKKPFFILTFSLIVIGLAHDAQAQDRPPYDGTGSQALSWSGPPPTAAEAEMQRTTAAKQLQDLTKAAGQGDRAAALTLAGMFEQGSLYVPMDRAKAFDLYEVAAQQGDPTGREKMCVAYVLGDGRPVDRVKGLTYCQSLGNRNGTALFSGGYDFEHGITGPKDDKTAAAFYVEAGKLGSAEAMDTLGVRALARSKPEDARNWFRRGVSLGSAAAMDHLAVMTEAGQGGPADPKEAHWLYVNAARRGNAHAAAWLAALPAPPVPLPQSRLLGDEKDKGLITRTYVDKKGAHTELFDTKTVVDALTAAYPLTRFQELSQGAATIHCYVDAGHVLDVCIIQAESPLGYGYGRILAALFGDRLTAEDKGLDGLPTANTVFAFTVNWACN